MLRQLLKTETHNEHLALEKVVNFSLITSCSQSYARLLTSLLGFYLPIESCLKQFADDLNRCDLPLKDICQSEKLESDLNLLTNKRIAVEQCADLPKLENLSQVLGLLYVLEGSHLGGQYIFKHISFTDRQFDKTLLSFHQGHEDKTSERWKLFTSVLNTHPGLNSAEVVQTAKDTFNKLNTWMVKNG